MLTIDIDTARRFVLGKFGYYTMPILWGDRLVARFDLVEMESGEVLPRTYTRQE